MLTLKNYINIFAVLTNHETRHKFIRQIPKSLDEYMEKCITSLRELDNYDNKGRLLPADAGIDVSDGHRARHLYDVLYEDMDGATNT